MTPQYGTDSALVPCSVLADLVTRAMELIGTIEKLSVNLVSTSSPMVGDVRLPEGFLIHALTPENLLFFN